MNHGDGYKVKPKFYVINFDDLRRSHRAIPFTRISWRTSPMPTKVPIPFY